MCSLLNVYSRPGKSIQRYLHKTSHQRIAKAPQYIEYQKVYEKVSGGGGNPNTTSTVKAFFKNTPSERVRNNRPLNTKYKITRHGCNPSQI